MMNFLGAHAQIPSGALREWVATTKPGIVKVMFHGEPLRDLMALSPGSTFIYRMYTGEAPHDFQRRMLEDPIGTATERMIRILDDLDVPQGVYVEFENEVWGYDVAERSENGVWIGDRLLRRVDECMAHFGQMLLANGYGTVLGNCGTGNLEGKWFRYLSNSLKLWLRGEGKVWWGWHEYGWPNSLSQAPYHGLRHRLVIDQMVAEGIVTQEESRRLWSVITEFGCTRLVNRSGEDMGYLTLRDDETGGMSPGRYHWEKSLQAYNEEIQNDQVLMGICHYMTGSEDRAGTPRAWSRAIIQHDSGREFMAAVPLQEERRGAYDWRTFDTLRDQEGMDLWRDYAKHTLTFNPKDFFDDYIEPEPEDEMTPILKSTMLHQFDYGLREKSVAELAATLRLGGIDTIKCKTHQGTFWMKGADSSPLSFRNVQDVRERFLQFKAEGITMIPWCVLDGRQIDAEVRICVDVAKACDGYLEIDLEPYGRETPDTSKDDFYMGKWDDIPRIIRAIKEGGVRHLSVDAHVTDWTISVLRMDRCVEWVDMWLGQSYWSGFKQPDPATGFRYEARYWKQIGAKAFGYIFPAYDANGIEGPGQYFYAYQTALELGATEVSLWAMNVSSLETYENFAQIPLLPRSEEVKPEPVEPPFDMDAAWQEIHDLSAVSRAAQDRLHLISTPHLTVIVDENGNEIPLTERGAIDEGWRIAQMIQNHNGRIQDLLVSINERAQK